MAVNIKNPEVDALIEQMAALTGETKTETVRRALLERRARLAVLQRNPRSLADALEFMEREVWSTIPHDRLGRPPLSRAEEDAVLGFGPEGV